jgi:hypothetical protein
MFQSSFDARRFENVLSDKPAPQSLSGSAAQTAHADGGRSMTSRNLQTRTARI